MGCRVPDGAAGTLSSPLAQHLGDPRTGGDGTARARVFGHPDGGPIPQR